MVAPATVPGILLTGTHSARPAATVVSSGALYSCSTHALVYQSDGTVWDVWATLGGSAAAVSSAGVWVGTPVLSSSTLVANRAYYTRVVNPFAWTPNRIAIGIQVSSGNLDLGIYADDGTGANPGARIVSTGSTASPGTGLRQFTIAPGLLSPGVYWLAFTCSSGTGSFGYTGTGAGGTVAGGGPIRCLLQDTALPLPVTAGVGLASQSWAPAPWIERV